MQIDVKTIPPLRASKAALFFCLPLLLSALFFWGLSPLMDLMAVRLFVTFLVSQGVPIVILLLLSLRFFRKEGQSWSQFRERFRLHNMSGTDWLWTLGLAAFLMGTYQILSSSSSFISEWILEPKFLVRMMENDPNYFMELPIHWLLFAGMLLFVVLTVIGEELWWRGYVFPRQEVVHGKWTWLVHGILWWIYHLFMPWDALQMLPVCLALPFVVQRRRNTWVGIIAHFAWRIPMLWRIFTKLAVA